MRIEHTAELYSENQRERWSSHQWYFLYKIITFFDVLLLVTKAIQRGSGKKQRKLRREKNWWAKIRVEFFRKMPQLSFVTDWKISFLEILSIPSNIKKKKKQIDESEFSKTHN